MAGLLLLAGCGSLPTLNPDIGLHSAHPVRLQGARGPLTYQQSKDILARLKKGAEETNIFDRHLLVQQEIDATPLVVGNKVQLLKDGPPTYASMFAAIAAAKDHINLETFILEDDEMGQRLIDSLLQRQTGGIQVNVIYDSVGSLGTPKEFFKPLLDAGANIVEYNPVNPLNAINGWELNQRDHRKLLVVDGRTAFVGGINISSVYTHGSAFLGGSLSRGKTAGVPAKNAIGWRDTHLLMQGPVVAEFQKLFMETWEQQKGATLEGHQYFPQLSTAGSEVARAIGTSPDDPSLMYLTLLSAINSAETRIWLTNAYFVPDQQLLTALTEAATRGVDVRLLLPGKTDSNLVFYASHSFYDELLRNGVKIYERQTALLHAKTAMIDGVWSTVGSTNLDWRSLLHNQEIDAVVLGQEFGAQMQMMFEEDLQVSNQITLTQWRKRPLIDRIKEFGARLCARIL